MRPSMPMVFPASGNAIAQTQSPIIPDRTTQQNRPLKRHLKSAVNRSSTETSNIDAVPEFSDRKGLSRFGLA